MKRGIFLLMLMTLIIAGFAFLSCDDSKAINANEANAAFPTLNNTSWLDLLESVLNKSNSDNASITDLAKFLATDKKWLKKSIIRETRKTGVQIDQLVDEAKSSQIKLDGIDYTIKVELFNGNRVDILDQEKFSYGVALDADLFYHDQNEIPVYYWNEDSKEVETRTASWNRIDKGADMGNFKTSRDAIVYPLFFVSIESDGDPNGEKEMRDLATKRVNEYTAGVVRSLPPLLPCEDCGGDPPPPHVYVPYFVVKQINLFDKKDDSNDEFEMYIGEEVTNDGRIRSSTIHKFNGNTRNDIAGRPVYYRDVNGDQGWEIMSDDIAIWPLAWADNTKTMRILDVEDDDDAGEIDYGWGGVFVGNFDHFRITTGTVLNSSWEVSANTDDWWPDNDDFYSQSGIDQINESTVKDYLTESLYLTTYVKIENRILDDLDYWVGVRKY